VAGRIGAAPVSPPRIADVPVQPGERLTPEAIVEELVAQLPHDAIISLEGSTLGGPWLRTAHRAALHRVMTNTGGAIGQGLPCAVGAALAAPEARIIALQSDGSGHYTLQALWTMARERLPVTIIIAANHRYGILQTELTRADVPLDQSAVERLTRLDHPRADWTALAAGYGVAAIRVDTPEAFADALRRGLAEQGPLLIQAELP
jgi:acetolactate synthase-1/2/3 large subunit